MMLSYFHLLLFHALRDPFIYPDSDNYLEGFNLALNCDTFTEFVLNPIVLLRFEPGYMFLNYLVSRFWSSDYTIFIVSSVVIISGYLYAVYKYSKAPVLSILIILIYPMIFQQSFFVLRQHMACAIFMFSLPYIEKRMMCKFILMSFIAVMFHYSAIILIPLYWIYNLKIFPFKLKYITYFLLAFIVVRALFGYLSNINERYSDYMVEGSNFLVCGYFIITTILLLYFLKHRINLMNNTVNRLIIMYNFYSLAICLITVGLSLGRMTNYFSFFLCIIIPFLYKCLPKPLGIIVATIYLLFSLLFNKIVADTPFLYESFIG